MKTIICIIVISFATPSLAWTGGVWDRMFNGAWQAFISQQNGYTTYQPGAEKRDPNSMVESSKGRRGQTSFTTAPAQTSFSTPTRPEGPANSFSEGAGNPGDRK